ncbi:MAG: PCRF domain-containing protein, partial [Propionibacteriaceae bacterium]|nr:PCRF domain-containing protein [Propionibacteriaceae bacterium]
MATADDLRTTASNLSQTLTSIESVVDVPTKQRQIADLEAEASAPDLWSDQEHAQAITSRLSRLQADVERVTSLRRRLDDVDTLVDLAVEEDDQATLDEAEATVSALKPEISALEIRTLLSGEYDDRDALVTIRSEAGGVDAADFADMLFRMYLRWAERHKYPVEVWDTSYAEEAGLKSATFTVK